MNTGKHEMDETQDISPDINMEKTRKSGNDLFFTADAGRYLRILTLLRSQNNRNKLPDKLGDTATMIPLFVLPLLLLWAVVFANATLVKWTWFLTVPCIGVPVLLLLLAEKRFGLASWFHRFRKPELTLGEEGFTLSLQSIWPGRTPLYRWTFPYKAITRMEYERSVKSLRIYGKPDADDSRMPKWDFVPAGMRKPSEHMKNPRHWVELPLVFPKPEELLGELERRSGQYIRPAMQGDDLADLRDLPGIDKERDRFRLLCVSILVFSSITLLSLLGIERHFAEHPYRPYPPTDTEALLQTHSVGDTVTLDGCDIQLQSVTRVASGVDTVCYQILLVLTNRNEDALRMRVGQKLHDSTGNIAVKVGQGDAEETLTFTDAPAGYTGFAQACPKRLESGINVYATFFVWIPNTHKDARLIINSDHWPPDDFLRDVSYTGEMLTLQGQEVKSNEIRFALGE